MTSIGKENRSSQYLSYNREGERQRQKERDRQLELEVENFNTQG